MNYTDLNLDLQGIVKRAYENLLYRSTFMNFLNSNYLGEIRIAGTPMIEVMKNKAVAVNTTEKNPNITAALTPVLASYDSVKVDLTELRIDYSINVSPLVSNIAQAISGQIEVEDAEAAKKVDIYGYKKLSAVENTEAWAPADKEGYIDILNSLKAKLFNNNVYDGYKLGLEATEYGKLVSAITSVLKYETMAGVEGVDRGTVANAYGIDMFPINSSVIGEEKGYFASEVGTVGDAFFTQFNQWNGDRPGYPGMISIEGIILFGAEVVRPEAVIKLVATA